MQYSNKMNINYTDNTLNQPKIAFKQPTPANTTKNAKKYLMLNGSLNSPLCAILLPLN